MDSKYVKCKIGLFLSITLFAVCALAQETAVPRFRQHHRVFAVERDKIDAACEKYPNSFRDGIIVATFVGLQIGKPEVREFANHKEFSDFFKSKTSICRCASAPPSDIRMNGLSQTTCRR